MIYNNILETIGNTPVVRLNRMAPDHVDMYVKVESFNPMASVKDRLAFAIITDAENGHAETRPDRYRSDVGQHRHRAGHGVRGQGLPVCRDHGRFVFGRTSQDHARPRCESHPDARRRARHRHGQESRGACRRSTAGFLRASSKTRRTRNYHRQTTGPEILRDFAGKRLDYWVTGYGTGGTMTGAGEILKAARPDLKIVATEPAGAALLAGKEWAPHKIQGWTPDFIPEVLNREVFDELVPVG